MKKLITVFTAIFLLVSLSACNNIKNDDNFVGSSDNSAQQTDTATSVVVSTENFPKDTVIKVEAVKDDTRVKSILTKAQSVEVYDINAMLDNKTVQPSAEVEVAFPIPEAYDSDKHIIEVYYISDDGKTEKIDITLTADSVLAKLNHFSVYVVAIVQKPTFNLALETEASVVEGEKALISDKTLTFTYNPNDTWATFVENNKDAGFLIDKDFYGKKDLVYYEYNGTREQIVVAVGLYEVKPDDIISQNAYACMVPHRETLQGQWFYDVSNEPFMVEGYLQPFDRKGKTIIIDTNEMTYIIKQISLQKISANTFVSKEDIIASGKYTSDDGDTLGATLTLDNGYVIKTTRSNSFKATLELQGKSIDITTADQLDFYKFN